MEAAEIKRIKSCLAYDPETGKFTWLKTISSHAVAGREAGTPGIRGSRKIQLDRKMYQASRLAFVLMTGRLPSGVVIFIDKDPSNLAFNNLRDTSKAKRMHRRVTAHKHTKSQLLGAHYHKKSGKWASQFRRKGQKRVHFGLFDTPEEAHREYLRRKSAYESEA